MKTIHKAVLTLLCAIFVLGMSSVNVQAANVTITFLDANKVTCQTVAQGSDATLKAPTDVNVPGFVFCGWDKSLKNVQSNMQVQAVYLPLTAGSGAICSMWQSLPTGILSYTTNNANTLKISSAQANVLPTQVAIPCHLTATQVVTTNPVGVPGKTCVVRWYNGSTGELWGADVVPYGTTLPQPANPCMAGLEFIGWDGSWSNITSDRIITACYYKTYTVKYICGICGEVQDIQIIRQSDGAGVRGCSHHHHEGYTFKYWSDPAIQGDGVTALITSVYEKN